MKRNDRKHYQRKNILAAKERYWAAQKELNDADSAFQTIPCEYRTGNMCGHSRHTMKKWPGHNPVAPLCGVPSCPME